MVKIDLGFIVIFCSVYGEYRLSPLKLPPPAKGPFLDRPSGQELSAYFQAFSRQYLDGKIQFNKAVQRIRRHPSGKGWSVEIQDTKDGSSETREYARIVLCTGVGSSKRPGCYIDTDIDRHVPRGAVLLRCQNG